MKVEYTLDLEAIAEKVAAILGEREERWLAPEELAEHFACSVRTVGYWRAAGCPHLKVGSKPRFQASAVAAWLDSRA